MKNIDSDTTTKILNAIGDFRLNEYQSLSDYKQSGGTVGVIFNRYFPLSLLYGLGIRPLRITSGTTIEAEGWGEKIVRPDTCPFCKTILGNFDTNKKPHSFADFIVGIITCDQMRRTLERLSANFKLPFFPLQIPATLSSESENYYLHGVAEVVKHISAFYTRTSDMTKIREIEEYGRLSSVLLSNLLLTGTTNPLVLHKLIHTFSWSRPQQFYQFLQQIYPKLPKFKAKKKVLVIGSIMGEEDDYVIQLLAQHRIFPVLLHSVGLAAVSMVETLDTISDKDLIRTLSQRVLKHIPSIRTRPNIGMYQYIQDMITKTNASGIILKTLSFCDIWYTEKVRIQRHFNIPTLVLNAGYGEGSQGRVETRIEAFTETITC